MVVVPSNLCLLFCLEGCIFCYLLRMRIHIRVKGKFSIQETDCEKFTYKYKKEINLCFVYFRGQIVSGSSGNCSYSNDKIKPLSHPYVGCHA